MNTSPDEQASKVLAKLAAARGHVRTVAKTKTADTGSYTYKYASLSDVLSAVDAALEGQSLQWVQHVRQIGEAGDRWQLVTTLIDTETGATVEFGGPINPVKGEPQAQGSALTYARRYALVTLFGMNVDDDDGAQAQRAAVAETSSATRTGAEQQIRELIKGLGSRKEQDSFKADFRDTFGCGLSELPESRHGEALSFAKHWMDPAFAPVDGGTYDE